MEKQFIVAQTPDGKVLRPINVPYPNEDDQEEEGIFQLADAVLYKQLTADLPYIGRRLVGDHVCESEIKTIKEIRYTPKWFTSTNDKNFLYAKSRPDRYETRITYADIAPPPS